MCIENATRAYRYLKINVVAGFQAHLFNPSVHDGFLRISFPPSAGLNPNMNVNNMDITGGLSVKDTSQSQSRLPQWTHPNSMDNLSSAASSLDQNSSKHGNVPCHCPPHVPLPAWLLVIPATVQLELFLLCSFFV